MLIQTAFVVAAFLSTWALVDFVLVFVTSLLPKHVEIDCAKQYAPQRIAILGPPKVDTSLDTLGDCGSVVTEYALRPGQSTIECVWRVLESSPGLVLIRDVAHDSLELARLIRKAGYIGVLLFYGPKNYHRQGRSRLPTPTPTSTASHSTLAHASRCTPGS